MFSDKTKLTAIPTNIITGFLGVGKTTAILHLLKQKAEGERWAVLVNEFGEIGIDGALLAGEEGAGVYIHEVPGGCMCCAAGVPMRFALNQLLKKARPDRLLIEPTGLGHPIEVLQLLRGEYYREVLSLQKILTPVDPRHLDDSHYRNHQTFRQQLVIADYVVANKCDLCSEAELAALPEFAATIAPQATLVQTEQGRLDPAWLTGPTGASVAPQFSMHSEESSEQTTRAIPDCGWLKAENDGEGFHSIGWRFKPSLVFERTNLFAFFKQLTVERMKAVFITTDGVFSYNLSGHELTEQELSDALESRIEIIATAADSSWEQGLLASLQQPAL